MRLHSTFTCLLKNTDDWYSGMDLGKLVGLVFIDLKRLLTLLIIILSARRSSFTVFGNVSSLGLNPTFQTENSFAVLIIIMIIIYEFVYRNDLSACQACCYH